VGRLPAFQRWPTALFFSSSSPLRRLRGRQSPPGRLLRRGAPRSVAMAGVSGAGSADVCRRPTRFQPGSPVVRRRPPRFRVERASPAPAIPVSRRELAPSAAHARALPPGNASVNPPSTLADAWECLRRPPTGGLPRRNCLRRPPTGGLPRRNCLRRPPTGGLPRRNCLRRPPTGGLPRRNCLRRPPTGALSRREFDRRPPTFTLPTPNTKNPLSGDLFALRALPSTLSLSAVAH